MNRLHCLTVNVMRRLPSIATFDTTIPLGGPHAKPGSLVAAKRAETVPRTDRPGTCDGCLRAWWGHGGAVAWLADVDPREAEGPLPDGRLHPHVVVGLLTPRTHVPRCRRPHEGPSVQSAQKDYSCDTCMSVWSHSVKPCAGICLTEYVLQLMIVP